ncbi:hypothetical protein D3C80_826240 [compost metagenome]
MCQGFLGQVDAAEHARNLFNTLALAQIGHGSMGGIAVAHFVHEQVVMALGGHLRQVGDGQHLAAFAQATQQLTDDLCRWPADTHVDFVEYQGRDARGLRGDHLDRQADPRQLATGGNLGQGLERLPGVGADQQLDLFQALGLQFVAAVGPQLDTEAPARHAQALDFLLHGAGQLAGGLLAQGAQFTGLVLVVAGIGGQLFSQALDRFVVGVEVFQLFHQALLQAGQLGRVHPVLAGEGIDGVEALFELLQARRVGIEVVEEAVQLANGFFYLDLRAGDHGGRLAQGLGRVVHGGQAVEAGSQGVEYVARIVFAAVVDDLAADAEQRFGIGQVLVFLFQELQFVLAQAKVVQFFELVAEQLVLRALLIAGIGQPLQFLAGLAPAYSSSRRRWVSVFSSDWCSCWLWMSISSSPRALRSPSGQGVPLI